MRLGTERQTAIATHARRIRDTDDAIEVAARLAAELAPGAVERDRGGEVPRDALAALDASGLLGITVPASDRGAGLGPVALAEVVRRLAVADPAIAQVPQGHYLCMDVLGLLGTDHQRRRLYADALGGARFGSALAERGGAHAQELRTRLRCEDGRLVLRGHKHYCTGALTARWLPVSALDEHERLVLVFVPTSAPGLTLDDEWHAMGQRATVSGAVVLDDVVVDPGLVVPYWQAFQGPQLIGARAQLVHAAIEVGIARAALDDASTFLRERARPFFEPVRRGLIEHATDDPYALVRLGRLAAKVAAAESLLRDAAGVVEGLPLAPTSAVVAAEGSLAVAAAKAFGSDVAVEVTTDLFAITGASGTDRRLGLDRHWRNARTHSVHDPVDWKYHHLGAFAATGALPPSHGQI